MNMQVSTLDCRIYDPGSNPCRNTTQVDKAITSQILLPLILSWSSETGSVFLMVILTPSPPLPDIVAPDAELVQ